MTTTVMNRTVAIRRGRVAVREAQASPREATQALDRSTAWPVHRIRWFLLSQPAPVHRRTLAA